jgi:CRP-like cAMP-binding protein
MFAWLEPAAVSDLATRMTRRGYDASCSIYSQGDPGDEMYRVVNGYVRLSVYHPDGRRVVFLLFGPGDFFGASSLVDQQPRPQTAEALTFVELDVLPKAQFRAIKASHPSFSDALMRLFILQMRVASGSFVRTHLNSLAARVARRILELAGAMGEQGDVAALTTVRVHQSELADMVGAARQSTNRVLKSFQKQGLIDIATGMIMINDATSLEVMAEY